MFKFGKKMLNIFLLHIKKASADPNFHNESGSSQRRTGFTTLDLTTYEYLQDNFSTEDDGEEAKDTVEKTVTASVEAVVAGDKAAAVAADKAAAVDELAAPIPSRPGPSRPGTDTNIEYIIEIKGIK